MGLRKVKVNNALILREDGKLFKIDTKEEFVPSKGTWTGYRISIHENGKHTIKYVHWLVLTHFGPPCPGPDYLAQHINGDKYDNRLKNLRWATRSEVNRNRIDSLPVGQRRCDFDDEAKYRCSNTKRWQLKNPDKVIEYRENNRERERLRAKDYYSTHTEQHKESCRNWDRNNPEKRRELGRRHSRRYSLLGLRKRNKETDKRCTKNWREKNPEKVKATQKKWESDHREHRRLMNEIYVTEHPDYKKQRKQKKA